MNQLLCFDLGRKSHMCICGTDILIYSQQMAVECVCSYIEPGFGGGRVLGDLNLRGWFKAHGIVRPEASLYTYMNTYMYTYMYRYIYWSPTKGMHLSPQQQK